MVATATRTILESLDRLPNRDDRTKIAIIAFDVALHFFSIAVSAILRPCYIRLTRYIQPGGTEATMLVVSDLDDVFLPKPNDLLLNLTECRAGVESLLARLPEMFQDSHAVGSALGPALQAGFKLTVRVLNVLIWRYYFLTCLSLFPCSHLMAVKSLSLQPVCQHLVPERSRTVKTRSYLAQARFGSQAHAFLCSGF